MNFYEYDGIVSNSMGLRFPDKFQPKDTPEEQLLRACQEGNLRKVKRLVKFYHIDPRTVEDHTRRNYTPLHWAAIFGRIDIVKFLVEDMNCDVECRDDYCNTPLHRAALAGRLNIVQYFIEERQCDPACRGYDGRTALHHACDRGQVNLVKYLVDNKMADPSGVADRNVTPLHLAAFTGQLPVVKVLVEDYLCDPSVRDNVERTPEDYARIHNQADVISYLSSIEKVVSTDLRRSLVTQLKAYTRKARPTGVVLGSGTYGSVIELKSAGEIVAGKVFKTPSTDCLQVIGSNLCRELILMAQMHHPSITVCKGVCLLPDQHLPILLMERLMSSLHAYLLDKDKPIVSLDRKVCVLWDVASGLDYLHSHTPAIIHRDLTATNVLLDSKLRAKIADFGNARIVDLDPEATPETYTSLPGTLEYMPPEAQGGSGDYDPSLDVFSFGHLALFTITQSPVQPLLPSTYTEGDQVRARSEVKRRQEFVHTAEKMLHEDHSLVLLTKKCLHNKPSQRPSTKDLLTRLGEMVTEVAGFQTPATTHQGTAEGKLSAEPRLAELTLLQTADGHKIEIIKGVAAKWRDICVLLNFDKRGETLDRIAVDHSGVESSCLAMFQYWLHGNGERPATWATLLGVLEKGGFPALSREIEMAMHVHVYPE